MCMATALASAAASVAGRCAAGSWILWLAASSPLGASALYQVVEIRSPDSAEVVTLLEGGFTCQDGCAWLRAEGGVR